MPGQRALRPRAKSQAHELVLLASILLLSLGDDPAEAKVAAKVEISTHPWINRRSHLCTRLVAIFVAAGIGSSSAKEASASEEGGV